MSEEFDSPWKEALDTTFEPFLALLFPDAHADIDWSRGYVLLDKELRQAIPEAEVGPRVVDFLAKVWRRSGKEEWVLVHVEVQSQYDAGFAERMFVYNRRIFDRFGRTVVSFAVLADDRPSWRPSEFSYNLWGCELRFRFPTVKLLEVATQRGELESSSNLFASVVLAHLDTQATRNDPGRRKEFKFELVRRLYDRNATKEQVRQIFKVIDWMMKLPKPADREFWGQLQQFEQERKMPYVTSVERIGIEKGLQQGLQQGLQSGIAALLHARFGPEHIAAALSKVQEIRDVDRLREILQVAVDAPSVDAVEKLCSSDD